ncbi:MAG: hypothetical protein IPP06_06140 [Saprospiraceae bacterium]|nr:hypothetical protein [Candidatus Vicinibacter affinis]
MVKFCNLDTKQPIVAVCNSDAINCIGLQHLHHMNIGDCRGLQPRHHTIVKFLTLNATSKKLNDYRGLEARHDTIKSFKLKEVKD